MLPSEPIIVSTKVATDVPRVAVTLLCANDVVVNCNKLGAIKAFVAFPLESVTVVGKVTCPCPAGETAQFSVAFGTGFPELSRTITVSRLSAGVTFWILITCPSPETMETVFWQKAAVASRLTPIAMRASTFAKEDEVTGILLIDV
jgi:hypothetical protein